MASRSNVFHPVLTGAGASIQRFFIALILLLPLSALHAASSGTPYELRYGILGQKADGTLYLEKQTLRIPFIKETEDKEFKFGYILKLKNQGVYLRLRISMPKPQALHANTPHVRNSEDDRTIIETQNTYIPAGESTELAIGLEEGDRPGRYRVELFINDKREQIIDFLVGENP